MLLFTNWCVVSRCPVWIAGTHGVLMENAAGAVAAEWPWEPEAVSHTGTSPTFLLSFLPSFLPSFHHSFHRIYLPTYLPNTLIASYPHSYSLPTYLLPSTYSLPTYLQSIVIPSQYLPTTLTLLTNYYHQPTTYLPSTLILTFYLPTSLLASYLLPTYLPDTLNLLSTYYPWPTLYLPTYYPHTYLLTYQITSCIPTPYLPTYLLPSYLLPNYLLPLTYSLPTYYPHTYLPTTLLPTYLSLLPYIYRNMPVWTHAPPVCLPLTHFIVSHFIVSPWIHLQQVVNGADWEIHGHRLYLDSKRMPWSQDDVDFSCIQSRLQGGAL